MAVVEGSPGRGAQTKIAARSSMVDAFKGCGLSGMGIDKEELRRRVLIPRYLRVAMVEAVRGKNPAVVAVPEEEGVEAPETPLVVFVNSKSGGRHGPQLKVRLQELMSEEQVFDLSNVNPSHFVQYGLACLERLSGSGDDCAENTRQRLRVMVAGGDGTVGWVLGSLGELIGQNREPVPPVGIIPLGTGNDLSRSFGWGGSFPFVWRSAMKRSLLRAAIGPICRLDSWQIVISMPKGEKVELPHSLKLLDRNDFSQDLNIEDEDFEKFSCFGGVFYNYFSIGMDAQIAYGFHHLRNQKPYLAQGPITNKLIYSGYTCSQGWFCTPCIGGPGLRGLKNILQLSIKRVNCSHWEQIPVPSDVRSIVALNLHNYGSGRNPWGRPKPNYLEKRGFVEAHADDGLLEIFGLKQGWHASFVMVELITAKHIAQAAAIKLEFRGGDWRRAFMQMDGEPWKQPMSKEFSTFVEIRRVPTQSLMINGE
ncbi:hypothetical protein J5N97_026811 [Dioscorea zingiberensis]|uniref:Diacylglycerol kinase n=1 Tax=Dioscorea zingiberensis TaxID=325984 RepID=A0A9D5H718_9LILI|nr:hypothetical protein J5N97_026811 [Dioscorea zingiberensis]